MTTPSPLESRLAIIERNLAALSAELAAIRAELRAGASAASADRVPPLPSAEPPAFARPSRFASSKIDLSSADFERLLGRYGMLGIAVLAAVAAVGTFLNWAISHGYLSLGPGARVLIGLAFAVGIGVWGMRLRRFERSFGSSMLGLALVIVQVCAYAAGPAFHIVPTWLAFVGATVTSWSLAVFAHSENEERSGRRASVRPTVERARRATLARAARDRRHAGRSSITSRGHVDYRRPVHSRGVSLAAPR